MVHIGKVIKSLVKKSGMSVTDFADRINYSRRNVYDLFERETIDTGLLAKVSKVLGENLFMHYITDADIAKHKDSKTKMAELNYLLDQFIDKMKEAGAKKRNETYADKNLELNSKGVREKIASKRKEKQTKKRKKVKPS